MIAALIWILVVLIIAGVVMALLPMDAKIKQAVYILIALIVIVILLSWLLGAMPPLQLPK